MSWSDLLESVFTSLQLAVFRVRDEIEIEAIRQLRAVDAALGRLREAIAKQRDEQTISRMARDTYVRTLALAQLVHATPARTAVGRLLDLLAPYVTAQELAAREALLEGAPLELSLQKLFVA